MKLLISQDNLNTAYLRHVGDWVPPDGYSRCSISVKTTMRHRNTAAPQCRSVCRVAPLLLASVPLVCARPSVAMRPAISLLFQWGAPAFICLQSFSGRPVDPLDRFKRRRIAPQAPTNADNVPSVPVPSLPAPNIYIPDPDVTDPLARFKRNRKSESSSLSSSSSLPATSSGSSSSSSAACSSSSSYSIDGLNYLPPNVPNFFNTNFTPQRS
eukprot:g28819.t1